MRRFLFSLFYLLILKISLYYWQEKNTYYKTFSQQESLSALPWGFNVASFIKASLPLSWYLSCNFNRAVFSGNTVKISNWLEKLIQQSVVACGLSLQSTENPGGTTAIPATTWKRRRDWSPSSLLSALTGKSSFRWWIGSGGSNVGITFSHHLLSSVINFFFFYLVCFSGRLATVFFPCTCWGPRGDLPGAEGQGVSCALPPNNMFRFKCLSNCDFSSSLTPSINE